MKQLFTIFLCFIVLTNSNAQNYNCVSTTATHYFIDNNNYLRGIKIDSVKTFGADTVYYPFRTGRLYNQGFLERDTGSWLGNRIITRQDGTQLFTNAWDDTITIKPYASLNDNWTMYTDTLGIYFQATVTRIDTMTVLSVLDSVKTITISARDKAGVITTNPITGKQILLSKNTGFVQVFDLYCFPYRQPGQTTYALPYGYDAYYDIAKQGQFSLIDFHNPTTQELYSYSAWDVLFYTDSTNWLNPSYIYLDVQYHDTILKKEESSKEINQLGGYSTTISSYKLIHDTSTVFSEMPESNGNKVYYYPKDSSYCKKSPRYYISSVYSGGMSWEEYEYKTGIGLIRETRWYNYNPLINLKLQFWKLGAWYCGKVSFPTNIDEISPAIVNTYPNPASDKFIIENARGSVLHIIDMMGRYLQTENINADTQAINITSLIPGNYLLLFTVSKGNSFSKKLTKE